MKRLGHQFPPGVEGGGGVGGTPLYALFRYVWLQSVWFFSGFSHK